ncbi:hypothetical protein QWY90_07695 [Flavobacterium paronense]|uniref:Gliding motility lipoprotein GldH n=1 Tax=Flavobacterium paronense TaxID=1392775 RepID=A0ABV5GGT1_9FLAO|nr:hypothetical protein [Flavobacterium paronense]MDN3677195.1 hypothetical protein [Flavobacterium paronense]
MRKITLILAFIGMITLQSCTTNNDNIDNDTISEVFEYTNVNFLPNDYSVVLTYPHTIFNSDMVLVYRLSGSFQGEDIWKLLPETYYFDDGTLDLRYDFDFTRFDSEVHLEGYDLANVTNGYKLNQILRVVVVPGYFGKNNKMNFNDYKAVVKALNIDESKTIKIKQ